MSNAGLIDSANTELFNTYENDYQVSYNEAQQKLTQIRDLDGGMYTTEIFCSKWNFINLVLEEPRSEAMKAVERATDECLEIVSGSFIMDP